MAATGTTDVAIYNERGDAVATVKRNSTSADLPEGAPNQAVVLVGGVQSGSPDTYRALDMDASGRPPARLYDKDGTGITSSSGVGTIRAIDVAVQTLPVSNPTDTVWAYAEYSSTAIVKTTIVAFTVPEGKDFYLSYYSLNRVTDNNVGFQPAILERQTGAVVTLYDKAGASSNTDTIEWKHALGTAVKVGTAGDVVRLAVVPTGSQTTLWAGKLVGTLRPAG